MVVSVTNFACGSFACTLQIFLLTSPTVLSRVHYITIDLGRLSMSTVSDQEFRRRISQMDRMLRRRVDAVSHIGRHSPGILMVRYYVGHRQVSWNDTQRSPLVLGCGLKDARAHA